MPKKQKSTAGTVGSAEASGSTAADSEIDLQARSPWGGRRSVIRSAARRETSTQAKQLFKDADAAQKFYSKFKRKQNKLHGFSVLLAHNVVLILLNVNVQKQCSGATFVA
jgi:hypothetical protein